MTVDQLVAARTAATKIMSEALKEGDWRKAELAFMDALRVGVKPSRDMYRDLLIAARRLKSPVLLAYFSRLLYIDGVTPVSLALRALLVCRALTALRQMHLHFLTTAFGMTEQNKPQVLLLLTIFLSLMNSRVSHSFTCEQTHS